MRIQIPFRPAALIIALVLAIGFANTNNGARNRVPITEFSNIIQNFSEDEGYFLSDNLISNEDGYLSVLKKIRELGISGGAYIGVGPEQNFTYIAKTRPSIAFLIDIRRQAMLQHLMYKALFHLSKDRAEFLSRLLSRKLNNPNAPGADSNLKALVDYFGSVPGDSSLCISTQADVERTIQSEFRFPLSQKDRDSLASIMNSFYAEGMEISFKFQAFRRGGFAMPSLRDLLEQVDADGNPGNFLASADDYQFVRDLHERNRIIPVVGDFAGPKALKAIAAYLRKHSYSVSVFYTSNVEMYLFQSDSFDEFVKNVKALPITAKSLFIRSANNRWRRPSPGSRMSTMLQYISVFLKDHQDGLYMDYWRLVSTHSIPLGD